MVTEKTFPAYWLDFWSGHVVFHVQHWYRGGARGISYEFKNRTLGMDGVE